MEIVQHSTLIICKSLGKINHLPKAMLLFLASKTLTKSFLLQEMHQPKTENSSHKKNLKSTK